jgi:hypothetical protein
MRMIRQFAAYRSEAGEPGADVKLDALDPGAITPPPMRNNP